MKVHEDIVIGEHLDQQLEFVFFAKILQRTLLRLFSGRDVLLDLIDRLNEEVLHVRATFHEFCVKGNQLSVLLFQHLYLFLKAIVLSTYFRV